MMCYLDMKNTFSIHCITPNCINVIYLIKIFIEIVFQESNQNLNFPNKQINVAHEQKQSFKGCTKQFRDAKRALKMKQVEMIITKFGFEISGKIKI